MQASARNQLQGSISAIHTGSINDEVELTLAQGISLHCMLTHDSSQRLQLAVGKQATALVKASSVVLVAASSGYAYSARNQLSGQVAKVTKGAVNAEVLVKVAETVTLVAVITNDSADLLALAPGVAVIALFKSSSVILAVAQ